jgi:hypothetical protein
MIVFCPNCGTQNAGLAGARATCTACASIFDVPAEGAAQAPSQAAPPKAPPSFSAPGAQVFSSLPGSEPLQQHRGPAKTNVVAIISLVSGIVCCMPLLSPGLAIVGGIAAIRQIEASHGAETGRPLAIAGIALGAVTALLQFFWLIGVMTR